MSNGNDVSDELLERYRKVAAATVFSGVRRAGYEPCLMRGVATFTPGARLAARARTLRFIPPRPDIMAETHRNEDSPEFRAMGSCGPGDVLVCDALGMPHAGVGGDVKLLQLKMVGAEGIVTDGAIRDLDAVRAYGLKLFAGGRTPGTGVPYIEPYEENVAIQCGGIAVRPGDVIVGDDDGVVVVARGIAEEVIDWAEVHEVVEERVIARIQRDNVAPGKYYNPESIARIEDEVRRG